MNIDYFIPDEENQTRGFSDDAMARLRKYDWRIISYIFCTPKEESQSKRRNRKSIYLVSSRLLPEKEISCIMYARLSSVSKL